TSVGDLDAAFDRSEFVLETTCEISGQHAAAMEPHATVAEWQDGELTLRMSVQILATARTAIARTLGIDEAKVRIRSPFIGGGFGSKLGIHNEAVLAALAATALGAPVRVVQSRRELFANGPHRAATRQRIRLGADGDGRLLAIEHHVRSTMARGYPFAEAAPSPTHASYAADAIRTSCRIVPADVPKVDSMRAPGEAVGSIALETAIDEMAETCGMDPLRFRLANAPKAHPVSGKPFSTRRLEECLSTAASRFGWEEGPRRPGARREGRLLVGQGIAAAIRPNHLRPATAAVSIDAAGRLMLQLDMTDIGTGSYTILTQIASEIMGMRPGDVAVTLADTRYPKTSGSGGSFGAASAGSAARDACRNLKGELLRRARRLSDWHGVNVEEVEIAGGELRAGGRAVRLETLLDGAGAIQAAGAIQPGPAHEALEQYSYDAQCAEVTVDADVGEIRVRRMLGVFEAGRILNPKTARSQLMGGMIFGIGAALLEASEIDPRNGAFVHRDLAGYRIPVNADVPELEVETLDGFDDNANPLGGKGIGELGVCGAAAAIANAVYDATGFRPRRFPIRIEDVIEALPDQAEAA
ncbi:MAG: xanthine dehydrogenase family protein molybdopterin-binding subunit, partial [Alphaproteobacteria bacterium]